MNLLFKPAYKLIVAATIQIIKAGVCAVILCFSLVSTAQVQKVANKIVIYPMPKGELPNAAYKVSVSGKTVPVYSVKVGAADPARRFKAIDDLMHSADYFDTAAFAYFDMQGNTTVQVEIKGLVKSAKILPSSAGIRAVVHANHISFNVNSPKNLTIEINGETVKSLHLFINSLETDKPRANDPNVIYFGPGIHEVTSIVIGDNKTLYIAGGAILRAMVGRDEKAVGIEPSGLHNYLPSIMVNGRNIKVKGRGIIDAGLSPTHARNLLYMHGRNITVEGIILRNSSGWTAPIFNSDNMVINNIKIMGYRANTDGIDICNSRNVIVKNCFVRTNDDLIVVKSWAGQGKSNHIVVQNCVLWNQLAHALSLGAELREDVNDVVFKDCDIIHDTGREWALRIIHTDSSRISNILFENIRIEESHQLASIWMGKNVHTAQKKYGVINNITFKNISVYGAPLSISLEGGDAERGIENVVFKNVKLNNKPLNKTGVFSGASVKGLVVSP